MKNFGFFILTLALVTHIAVYAYGRYHKAETYTDSNARLDASWFVNRIVEQTPLVMRIDKWSDSTDIQSANKGLAIFQILPTIVNYKYQIDINTTINDEEKGARTDSMHIRIQEVQTIEEALDLATWMQRQNSQLSLQQTEANEQQNTRKWIAFSIFMFSYVCGILLVIVGYRKGKRVQ